MKIGTQSQMKKIDACFLEKMSIIELVDKASEALLEEVKEYDSFFICAGCGNNGADAYALAAKLHELQKKVLIYGVKGKRSEACAYYYKKCQDALLIEEDLDVFKRKASSLSVGVDGLFGFGLHSNPTGIYADLIQFLNACDQKILAIDLPSGLNCDSGIPYENCVKADITLTFFAMKLGFLNPASYAYTQEIKVLSLDGCIPEEESLCESVNSISFEKKSYDGHKGKYGKAVLFCGSDMYQGAALLSTKACVYSGCGITALSSTPRVEDLASLYVPEAIHFSRHELWKTANYDALLIGCGLAEDEQLLSYILQETSLPLVLDASALNMLAKNLSLLENQQRPILLTPHAGEFQRLCPDAKDLNEAAVEFARKYHVILILKGPHTLITDGNRHYRNMSGNGAMATGGSGDVLSGILVSFLAQHMDPMKAAISAVYLHGMIGDQLAQSQHTVLPSQLIERIPQAMKELENV